MENFVIGEFMTPAEVRASRNFGNMLAAKLNDGKPHETFRFPHAIRFALSPKFGGSYAKAVMRALELCDNPALTEQDARAFVNGLLRQAKQERQERTGDEREYIPRMRTWKLVG